MLEFINILSLTLIFPVSPPAVVCVSVYVSRSPARLHLPRKLCRSLVISESETSLSLLSPLHSALSSTFLSFLSIIIYFPFSLLAT